MTVTNDDNVNHGWSRYCNVGCRCDVCVTEARQYRDHRRRLGDRPSTALGMPDWMDHAACTGKSTEVFFGPDQHGSGAQTKATRWTPARAKAICESCPVREQCEEFANAEGIRFGVWGGYTAKERALRGEIRRTTRIRDWAHGTTTKYARGCRCHDCREAYRIAVQDYRERRRLGRAPQQRTQCPECGTFQAIDGCRRCKETA